MQRIDESRVVDAQIEQTGEVSKFPHTEHLKIVFWVFSSNDRRSSIFDLLSSNENTVFFAAFVPSPENLLNIDIKSLISFIIPYSIAFLFIEFKIILEKFAF